MQRRRTYCSFTCKTINVLEEHIEKHNSNSFKCTNCSHIFYSRDDLNRHTFFCLEGIDPVNCEYCQKSFVNETALRKHLKECNKTVDEYACPLCGLLESCERDLNLHIGKCHEKHTKEIFKCKECGYDTTSSSALRTHMGTHQTFKCNDCRFQSPANML